MKSSINLISTTKKEERHIQKFLLYSLIIFGGVFVSAGALLGYFLYLRNQVLELAEKKEEIRAQINSVPEEKVNALVLKDKEMRDIFLKELNDAGVMSRPVWRLMNELPMFIDCESSDLINSKWLEERVVNIPSSAILK